MIASQYKIMLPGNYDMDIIRKRVKDNGYISNGLYTAKVSEMHEDYMLLLTNT